MHTDRLAPDSREGKRLILQALLDQLQKNSAHPFDLKKAMMQTAIQNPQVKQGVLYQAIVPDKTSLMGALRGTVKKQETRDSLLSVPTFSKYVTSQSKSVTPPKPSN